MKSHKQPENLEPNDVSYGFRVCFCLPGPSAITSTEEFFEFVAGHDQWNLKVSAGNRGDTLTKSDRFSVSGRPFLSVEEAELAANAVWDALLLFSARAKIGVNLGQNSLSRPFAISDYYRNMLAQQLGADAVLEDHLGITVFPLQPVPRFIRMNFRGTVSREVQTFTTMLSDDLGKLRFLNEKARRAAGLYAQSQFAGSAPSRFLLLFISLEALFAHAPRSQSAQDHVDELIRLTKASTLAASEKESIASTLSFQKTDSIAATGRNLATSMLGEAEYGGMSASAFFNRIYKMRNDIVHLGRIDPDVLHTLIGEIDRFVADIVIKHASSVGPTGPNDGAAAAQPLAQPERQRQATKPGPMVRGTFSPARPGLGVLPSSLG